jgi:hypothetical protein
MSEITGLTYQEWIKARNIMKTMTLAELKKQNNALVSKFITQGLRKKGELSDIIVNDLRKWREAWEVVSSQVADTTGG